VLDHFANSILCKVTIGGGGTKPGQRGDPAHPRRAAPGLERYPVRAALLKPHPVREALLELIRRNGAVTATDAARELGGSSGLYSFHLRQLARYGLIEEAPGPRGRVRPWRLAGPRAAGSPEPLAEPGAARSPEPLAPGLGAVARGLEDEIYRRWLEYRDAAPGRWRRDEAFSQVVYLTPDEMAGMAEVIRALIGQYRYREDRPGARPRGVAPVAVVARLFPLLEPGTGEAPGSR
jgi:Helix-turn-helix domain